ncbi:MAG: hypothetical protein FD187_2215 [bacterium]|nr:MAG: hypothetical protein FD142_2590 [bacterium]KAF0148104.1 MAG: hypothetical protein FD187_2215 [bacterium]KAF0167630.1 MAG: hypothetical protein FD158_2106 [bacterium]TXT19460.1 MAG: hypothetical protein FD132_1729 [bacterium]
MTRLRLAVLPILLFMLLLGGCAPLGAPTIARDRFEYTNAVAESWKRQMLLNILKIRYGDAPIFLDVTSIINQYSLETEVRGTLGWSNPPSADRQELGGTGRYYDRPTITYAPLSGEKFARNLMTPISPATVMSLVEGGYPIDMVFRILVHSVNGLENQFGGSARMRRADPQFYELLEKMRLVQASGAIALRVKKTENAGALVMVFRKHADERAQAAGKEVRRLLGLDENIREFRVVYGSTAEGEGEIALRTRSFSEILTDIASTIEVPPEHVAEQRVQPSMEPEGEGVRGTMVRIRYSREVPEDAFASVPYRNGWFWINDRDFQSKRLFSFLMFVMTLTETGGGSGAPIVTISAGG